MTKLLQEELSHDPWKMLVACFLLNKTTSVQVRSVIWDVFKRYPDPSSMSLADPVELASMIRPCGLYSTRAKRIIRMSSECVSDPDWKNHPERLHGVGRYASDSWKIFQLGVTDISVTDKVLQKYLDSLRKES